MGDPRPTDGEPTQERQAELLTRTGNGPTADNEQELLRAAFGEPDEHGVYGAPTEQDGGVDA